jgi:arabinogalactan endo-1,4-beta-galactosidase
MKNKINLIACKFENLGLHMNSKFKSLLGLGLGLTLFTISGNTQAFSVNTFTYRRAMHSAKCLHINDGTQADNYPVTQWSCVNQPNVKWSLQPVSGSSSYYRIRSQASNKCLRVKDSSTTEYAQIVQYNCNSSAESLKWSIVPVRDNHYYIKNKYTGKCVHVHDASQSNGAAITQRTCENIPNILWRFG